MGIPHADHTGHSRRDFLRAAGLSAAGLASAGLDASERRDFNCILLMLVGGPSQLDTFDLKPSAPADVRGPFRPIRTSATGVHLCEHFPRLAQRAHRFAVVRSVHHDAAPIHETGHQLMQTGHLFRGEQERPHYGAVLSHLRGARRGAPANALVPGPIENTGVSISHGQGAAHLGEKHEPAVVMPKGGSFHDACQAALKLVEGGTRFVTVNMFRSVFNEVTWDCHADGGSLATTLDDYKNTLCPVFDLAYSALLDGLHERGLLDSTLVVATGEFGRTPHLNGRGGRDHWPGVWSALFAGAGVRGGQVVGSSDKLGGEPNVRPVSPREFAATVYHALGLPAGTTVPGPEGASVPLVSARPVEELFR